MQYHTAIAHMTKLFSSHDRLAQRQTRTHHANIMPMQWGPNCLLRNASVRQLRRHCRCFVTIQKLKYCETALIFLPNASIVSYGLKRHSKKMITVWDGGDL